MVEEREQIVAMGKTSDGAYVPLKVDSTGQLDVTGVGTVYVGTINIGEIRGSVHVEGGSVGIKSGSIGITEIPSISGTVDIRTGSVGISGQPIDIHGSVGIKEIPSITGSVGIKGTVNIDITAQSVGQIGVDMQGRYFAPQTLINGSVIGGGSVYISGWYAIDNYKTKTITVKTEQKGSLTIETCIVGTATDNFDYISVDTSAGTIKPVTFTDAFRYCRVKVYSSSHGSIWCWLGRQI